MVQASTLPSNESPGAGGRSFIQRRIQGQARSWELTCRSSGPQPLALIPRHARSSAATGGRGSPAPWTAPQPSLHPPSPPRLERSLFPVRSPTARTESRHERVSPHSPGQHLPRGRPGKQSDHPPRRLTHGLPQIQRHESQHRRHRQDRGRLRCSRFLDQEPTESKIHELNKQLHPPHRVSIKPGQAHIPNRPHAASAPASAVAGLGVVRKPAPLSTRPRGRSGAARSRISGRSPAWRGFRVGGRR